MPHTHDVMRCVALRAEPVGNRYGLEFSSVLGCDAQFAEQLIAWASFKRIFLAYFAVQRDCSGARTNASLPIRRC